MTERHKIISGIFLLLITIGIGVWQFTEMQANKIKTNTLNLESQNLTALGKNFTDEYQTIKTDALKARESSTQELALVFPVDEDLTNLTRMFDDFAVKNNFSTNPFFISDLKYGGTETPEGENYSFVPVTMNITTSEKNLNKFLEYIETSGSLEGQTRLMGIEDISISYPDEYGGTYDVKLNLNAYMAKTN